jgi:hypothetical protein
MPTATGGPPPDDSLRALTAALGGHHHPALDAHAWIVIVFSTVGAESVVACNHYTDRDAVFAALDAVNAHQRAEVHVPAPLTLAEQDATMRYTAPARRAYTGAHIRDDERDPTHGNDGYTACGRPLLYDDLWIDLPPAQADPVCTACQNNVTQIQEGVWE